MGASSSCRHSFSLDAVTVRRPNWAGLILGGAVLALGLAPQARAQSLADAIAKGTPNLDLRLRYESVEQDNAAKDADALTIRTRLGYTTQTWNGLAALVEMEDVSALIDDYAPAQPAYSTVADPEGTSLNQYGLKYSGVPGATAMIGRSRLVLDNARWVGNVGWRQNEQTYDGAFLKYAPAKNVTLQYDYLSRVHTITDTRAELDGHLVNAKWDLMPSLSLVGYAYLLDYEGATASDFDTVGLRASGAFPLSEAVKLKYTAEYASQDAETPTDDYSADYLLGELGVELKAVSLTAGYELLGSDDGAYGLQTPLATKHAFNGWADVFLSTPPTGLEDLYVKLAGTLGPVKLAAVYHDYSADESSPTLDDLGSEIDLSAGMKLFGKVDGLVKYASYSADDFGVDTDKLWLQLEYKF